MTDLILCTLRRCEHEPIHMNEDCARSKQHLATEDFCSSVGANPSIVEVAHRFTLGFYLFGDLASLTKKNNRQVGSHPTLKLLCPCREWKQVLVMSTWRKGRLHLWSWRRRRHQSDAVEVQSLTPPAPPAPREMYLQLGTLAENSLTTASWHRVNGTQR